ncbi:MAG: homocysteine S-methyltransferase family protein [Candidatus Schekmanbacteria bacterium]|nr:homocysteine S-methyltransferase family protein [Candidatus Schekmanbacteria bacterium]
MTQLEKILKKRIFIFDGATGTMLQGKDVDKSKPPEMVNIEHPEWLQEIGQKYIDAGCEALETNTFGSSRIKFSEFFAEDKIKDKIHKVNFDGVKLLKKVAKNKALIAASIGPTGKLMYPMGELTFDEAVAAFKEQIKPCVDAGADIIIIETMSELSEIKAAIIAAKSLLINKQNKPIIATMTFQTNLRSLVGVTPEIAAVVLSSMGLSAIGANCSLGIDGMVEIAKQMKSVSVTPLICQPNAGLPQLIDGKTVFPATPSEMAKGAKKLVSVGANIIGGCCGTTPVHLKAMKKAVKGVKPKQATVINNLLVASRTKLVAIGSGNPVAIIGERINPTRRKDLSEKVLAGDFSIVREDAIRQVEAGASILDINMGIPGADEAYLMRMAVLEAQSAVDVPLMIDSSNPEAVEAGLKAFSGKAIINSISGEKKKLNTLIPIARKYGAAILALTVDETGVPKTAEGKLAIASKIVNLAVKAGIRREDIIVDCVVSTVAAEPEAAMETLRAIGLIKKKLGVATILGVSNVSHGLPSRTTINATFLAMAVAQGLDAAIANPLDLRMKEGMAVSKLLSGFDRGAKEYITYAMANKTVLKTETPEKKTLEALEVCKDTLEEKIARAVMEGNKSDIIPLVEQALSEGVAPVDVSNRYLIPALEKVGTKFQDNEMFLPQVLMSAEVIEAGFKRIKKEIKASETVTGKKIILATVKGDVHDIGKNIVSTLLQNHGFNVIDLGKNVPTKTIIERAVKEKADIIGLSALMTTTVMEMEKVIKSLKDLSINIPVAVGGAVVTQSFADKIGADVYAKDALDAVKNLKKFFKL